MVPRLALCATELVSHPWGGHRGVLRVGGRFFPGTVWRRLLWAGPSWLSPPQHGQLIIHIHHPKALRRAHRCSPDSNTTGLRHKARPRGLCGLTRAARWTSKERPSCPDLRLWGSPEAEVPPGA